MGSVHLWRETMERVWIDGESIPSIDQHLDKSGKELFWQVSELIDGWEARKGEGVVDSQTDRWSRSRWEPNILHVFKLVQIN